MGLLLAKAAIIKPGRTCVLGVGTSTPQSVKTYSCPKQLLQALSPTLLVADKLEDVEEVSAGQSSDHQGLASRTFLHYQKPKSIGFAGAYGCNTACNLRDLAALKPSYQAANIALATCLAEDFLGRPLDAEKRFSPTARCLHQVDSSCFSQNL